MYFNELCNNIMIESHFLRVCVTSD